MEPTITELVAWLVAYDACQDTAGYFIPEPLYLELVDREYLCPHTAKITDLGREFMVMMS